MAGTPLQPLDAVDGRAVLFFMPTGLHLHAHQVTRIDSDRRRERVTPIELAGVDVWREPGAEDHGVAVGHRVQTRQGTVATRLQREGQVAAAAVSLHAGLAVGADLARVVDTQRDGFLAVVHDHQARVLHVDGLRARTHRAEVVERVGQRIFQFNEQVREDRVDLLARRRVDGEAEGVLRRAVPLRVAGVEGRRRQARAVGNERHALLVGADVDTGLIRMLEVAVLEIKFAERHLAVDTRDLRGRGTGRRLHGVAGVGAGLRLRLDLRLPARRAAVAERAAVQTRVGAPGCAGGRVVAQLRAGLVVCPDRTSRLGQHRGVQADLLVRGRAVVVVREDDAQAAVNAVGVDHRVGEPALDRRACALPLLGELAPQLPGDLAPVRVLFGHQRRLAVGRAGRDTGLAFGGVAVEAVDGMDTLAHRRWAEGAVFVVPAVGRAVSGGQVPLGQMDVLADDVGRRAHLVVVDLVVRGHQVAVVEHRTVEGVQSHHQRLRGLGLGDDGVHVLPQRHDALLRVVIAHLVEHGVELQVRALVDARRDRVEQARAAGVQPGERLTRKEAADHTRFERVARVIGTGVVVRRADHRQ